MQIFSSSLLGIDVSENSIQLLALDKNRAINLCARFPFKANHGDEVANIIVVLKNAIDELKITIKRAALSLSYSAIIHKTVSLPCALDERALENFLMLNLEKYVGISVDQVSFDYCRTVENVINLIAVRKERIAKCLAIFKAVKLKPMCIDIDAFALVRAIHFLYAPTDPLVVINVDYGNVLTCVMDQRNLLHVHKDFIDDQELSDNLAQHIAHDWQICLASYHPTHLILSGAHLINKNLNELNLSVNRPVTIANPMKRDAVHLVSAAAELAPAMVIALGLALRRFDGY